MDNDDRVEGIYSGDEFHSLIQMMVSAYGRGTPVGIVWDENADATRRRVLFGMVVCQLQYGMTAYHFRVLTVSNGFSLHMLKHTKSVVSDYFVSREDA